MEEERGTEFDTAVAAGFFGTALTWLMWDLVAWWAGLITLVVLLLGAAIGFFIWREVQIDREFQKRIRRF
ncbi:hypothetical protein LZ318_11770 [Saccharopolyspora indica]|uniref:hypothetical protein n=1 Tax=Saccharopolyspora indica TaxID=1229659 RepID=UPI0022EB5F23|nr:hypothetical protein [Saccharopolyspora indica]MDA3643811.1 hypothetical protein [Saccharopolyspora indica]